MKTLLIWAPLLLAFSVMAYVRLSPQSAEKLHVSLDFDRDETLAGGVKRKVPADIADLHMIAMSEPRTRVFAGDTEDGHITYETRSLLWGFPDYTTIQSEGSEVRIYGRLRFGNSDLGVNAKRVDRWIDVLTTQ